MVDSLQSLIYDPCTSYALRAYLEAALDRDPVDVLNELEVAVDLMRQRYAATMDIDDHFPLPPLGRAQRGHPL